MPIPKQAIKNAKKALKERNKFKDKPMTSSGVKTAKMLTTGYYTKDLIKISKPEKGITIHLLNQSDIFKLILNQKFNNSSHIAIFLSLLKNIKNL